VAHVAAGAVRHLAILEVVARAGEQVVIAAVVVVQVADDDVGHLFRVDVDRPQSLGHRLDDDAAALGGHGRVESRVEDERSVRAFDHPHEVGERLVGVVWIAADVVLMGRAIVMRVADGEDFVDLVAHS
jgi:hypothetical protein